MKTTLIPALAASLLVAAALHAEAPAPSPPPYDGRLGWAIAQQGNQALQDIRAQAAEELKLLPLPSR